MMQLFNITYTAKLLDFKCGLSSAIDQRLAIININHRPFNIFCDNVLSRSGRTKSSLNNATKIFQHNHCLLFFVDKFMVYLKWSNKIMLQTINTTSIQYNWLMAKKSPAKPSKR